MSSVTQLTHGFAITLLAAACLLSPVSAQDLGTKAEYHAVLTQDWSLRADAAAPTRPLYLVGMEKLSNSIAPDVLVHRIENDPKRPCIGADFNCLRLSVAPESIASDIRAFVTHPKVLWPTHIVQIRADRKACALYSLYSLPSPRCESTSHATDTIGGVWASFDRLSAAIGRDIEDGRRSGKPVTHLVLLVTGWNTFQDESAKNFADWACSLGAEGPATFNPVYVGISWQSTWGNMEGVTGGMLSMVSFPNKSNDADEIGFTWANQLLNRYLMHIASEHGLPVLVIGHSFGTRIAAAAVHGRGLLRGLQDDVDRIPGITFVALQPAFSVNRVRPERSEPFYTNALPAIPGTRSFFTASAYDKATAKGNAVVGLFGKKPYLSSPQLLRAFGSSDPPSYLEELELWKVNCSSTGCSNAGSVQLVAPATAPCSRVPLIDATAIFNEGNGPSGAHSDVYDRAAAQLIFKLTDACTART